MLRGVLNGEEASSLALVREIVKLLAGDQKGHGQKLCFSVPAPPLGPDEEMRRMKQS